MHQKFLCGGLWNIHKKKNHQRVTFKYLPGFESTRLVYENTKQVKNVVTLLFFFFLFLLQPQRKNKTKKQTSKQIKNIQQNSLREVGEEKKDKHFLFLKSGDPSIRDNVRRSWTEYLPLNEVQSFYYYFKLNAFYY